MTARAPITVEPPEPAIIREAAVRALGEDRGPADITTLACVKFETQARARVFAKEACTLAGLPVAEQVLREQDPSLVLAAEAQDGAALAVGDTVLEISGAAASILTAERCALNFIQQLSGVATQTRRFVDAVAGTRCKILDTRKTVPGLRALQKYAVRCGGGFNHRFGLYDRFLIKDNHLALMESGDRLAEAVRAARALDPEAILEVEVDRLDQIPAILEQNFDMILLDNMALDEMRAAVALISGRVKIEASGNMTLTRVHDVAGTGVDFISVGALTHTVRSIDFSLEILPPE
ncbi:MAG TPA: carboxylating nicotinate-nucleotide diphosphorylase [Candidatus Methylacidiphilales bacterium]|jgi:nicotinate-nucleotide pyrophosphorylase (carboxylating)|nr:carboxylating nicotinate-nucleotide diphosphorylase [Candidatus Methylacidiphilales bacterium]